MSLFGQVRNAGGNRVSGIVTGAIIRYLRHLSGDQIINLLAVQLGIAPGILKNLGDSSTWVSLSEAFNIFEKTVEITKDPEVARKIGSYHMRLHEESGVADLLQSLGSPKIVYANMSKAAPKYTTFTELSALETGDAHAVVSAITRAGAYRDIHMCNFTKGLLENIPTLFNLIPAVVTESECQARGGRFCLYSIAWEQHQWAAFVDEGASLYSMAWDENKITEQESELKLDPATKIQTLEEQVSSLTTRLEEVYSTAADLLVVDDLDVILNRIAQRAGHSVNAPKFLLTVKTSDDEDYAIHHFGFTDREAALEASALLNENMQKQLPNYLQAEIRSARRHYGWLMAINPDGMEFFEQDKKTLTLYANYAATALDVATALAEARRSNATSNALLELSNSLSLVRTQKEVAQLIADTVPKVISSLGAIVFLWDEGKELFVEAARNVPQKFREEAPIESLTITGKGIFPLQEVLSSEEPLLLTSNDSGEIAEMLAMFKVNASLVSVLRSGSETYGLVIAGFLLNNEIKIPRLMYERLHALSSQATIALKNAKLLEQVSHMAWHDALTGLPNRRLFEDRLNQELARATRGHDQFTLFYLDLDKFKNVNDALGHQYGDELIRQAATRLTECVRTQDTVARLGGDEFAIILPMLSDKSVIERLADRILKAMSEPFSLNGVLVNISASIGATTFSGDSSISYDELVRNADIAMYESKVAGRNRFRFFEESMLQSDHSGIELENEIASALAKGQFEVLYQIQVNLTNLSIIGVEALLRWNHPEKGILLPDSFLPAAEKLGTIVELDKWVLNTACKQLKQWDQRGFPPIKMCVNLSFVDFDQMRVTEIVREALMDSGVSPERLEIEISAGILSREDNQLADEIKRLRSLGVRVAIDDAGLAKYAIKTLKRYEVDTIKIDTSIIAQMGNPKESARDTISTLKDIAASMGAQIIAEGVEASEASEELSNEGISFAQGFFHSPPLKPHEVENMIRASKEKIV